MEELSYVSDISMMIARELEARFLNLPPSAGLLFVLVQPIAAPKGICTIFEVTLGLNRNRKLEKATGEAIIKQVLEKEIEQCIFTIRSRVFVGLVGADGDKNIAGLNSIKT